MCIKMAEIFGRARFRNSSLGIMFLYRAQKSIHNLQELVHFPDFAPSFPPSTALPISYPPLLCFLIIARTIHFATKCKIHMIDETIDISNLQAG